MFVGRAESLALLAGARERARAGVPGRVLVEGPAGIGKTALVRHFLCGSGQVLRAAGEEAESELPFGVLAQLLGPRARWTDASAAGAELLERLDEAQEREPEPGGVGGEPVVVVVDDAQWADHASLQALTFAVRRLRADRMLVLVVVRDIDDARLPGGLRRCFTADDAVRVRLDGLASTELRRLGSELGTAGLTVAAADRLYAHTGGNPSTSRPCWSRRAPGCWRRWHGPMSRRPYPSRSPRWCSPGSPRSARRPRHWSARRRCSARTADSPKHGRWPTRTREEPSAVTPLPPSKRQCAQAC
ncbi:AAA family ATPase [Streptomyces galilaeus]